ncbi:protein involved in ribonucleotide reduction [Paenibacillus peoriae]|uniref:Protein involved in ribonucleotide reduction n=1 Tax=Paenibacillus peoriae TaxID=59893 RepID=A0ABU1QIP2_9BACL|nr:class Ib ribonucleoside-diphosphate reductase assembly flavoprotein NrdI [Paenibacillus peoriae]MDR6779529.1 protein involved in ribonucleotide reduction [Paenibacillus peoriae]
MLIVYDSLTGNVQRFVDKLHMKNIKIADGLVVDEPFVLITYTTGFGEVPKRIEEFVRNNEYFLKGVISSGNRNWGLKFGRAADIISHEYCIPLIHKFELSGNQLDIEIINERIKNI